MDATELRRSQSGTAVQLTETVGDDVVGVGEVGQGLHEAVVARSVEPRRLQHFGAALVSGLVYLGSQEARLATSAILGVGSELGGGSSRICWSVPLFTQSTLQVGVRSKSRHAGN